MTDAIIAAIVVAVPGTIAATGALIVAINNGRKTDRNAARIQEIHLLVNSKLDAFLALTKTSSFAEGVKQETDKLK